MPSNDKYARFEDLARDEREGRDFRVLTETRPSNIVVIAPHGGGIEPGTSEIVKAIAGVEFSCYCFEGLKRTRNRDLHITSTNYDEPRCLDLVTRSESILAVHGCDDNPKIVLVGGRNQQLKRRLVCALRDGHYNARTDSTSHSGTSPNNICNKGTTGQGCQLEISRGLRKTMFNGLGAEGRKVTTEAFTRFVRAVRSVLITE